MEYEILLSGSSETNVKTEAIVGQAVEEEPKGANVGLLVGILVFIIIVLVIAVVIYQKKNSELKTELNGPEECFHDFSVNRQLSGFLRNKTPGRQIWPKRGPYLGIYFLWFMPRKGSYSSTSRSTLVPEKTYYKL